MKVDPDMMTRACDVYERQPDGMPIEIWLANVLNAALEPYELPPFELSNAAHNVMCRWRETPGGMGAVVAILCGELDRASKTLVPVQQSGTVESAPRCDTWMHDSAEQPGEPHADKLTPEQRTHVENFRNGVRDELSTPTDRHILAILDQLAPNPNPLDAALVERVWERMGLTAPLDRSFAQAVLQAAHDLKAGANG